jgi:hypothetical protein
VPACGSSIWAFGPKNADETNQHVKLSIIEPAFSAAAGVMLGTEAAEVPWAALPAMPRITSTLLSDPEREIRRDTGEF